MRQNAVLHINSPGASATSRQENLATSLDWNTGNQPRGDMAYTYLQYSLQIKERWKINGRFDMANSCLVLITCHEIGSTPYSLALFLPSRYSRSFLPCSHCIVPGQLGSGLRRKTVQQKHLFDGLSERAPCENAALWGHSNRIVVGN